MRILFVSWDGPGTTYHESLFLPLLAHASSADDHVHVLQFSWASAQRSERNQALAEDLGLTYENYEIAGTNDVLRIGGALVGGIRRLAESVRNREIDVILARSIIPAAMILIVRLLVRRSRPAIIYDADGLPADERVEFAGWKERGLRHRTFRFVERIAVRTSAAVLVRSRSAKRIIRERTACDVEKLIVVVNGREPDEFAPSAEGITSARRKLGIADDAVVIVHQGSLGPQYMPDLAFSTFAALEHRLPRRSHCLVLTPSQNHLAVNALREKHRVRNLTVVEATPYDMGRLLMCADVGLAYRSPTLSQTTVAPIKIAEYLLSGVPVAYTARTGDMDDVLHPDTSVRITGVAQDAEAVAQWAVDEVAANREAFRGACVRTGRKHFSIDRGAAGYRRAFDVVRVE